MTGPPPAAAVADSCRAPWVSVRLSPNGEVQACCVNDAYPLGSIGVESLAAIWRGERAEALRAAMVAADFSLGCQGCGDPTALGLRAQTLATDYDHFALAGAGDWPRHIEFALSNTCNLQCVQCDGELSSAIRARRERRPPLRSPYGEAFFAEVTAFLPHLDAATFIGGEPFLTREARRIWDLLLELDRPPEVWVTTNGTIWDERVEHYLHALRMGVSVSIDGVNPETIAAIRTGADPEELLRNRDRFLEATRRYGRGFKLNFCLMPQNWQEYLPFLLEADRLDVPVFAARVQRPTQHSLYHLPVATLRDVVDGLRAEDRTTAARLGRNRPVWEGTLAELTAHLARAERLPGAPDGDSVPVGAPTRRPEGAEAQIARLRAEMARVGGLPPVQMTILDRRVVDVDSPPWAAFLGLDGFVGIGEEAILSVLSARVGASVEPDMVPGEEEIFGCTFYVPGDGASVALHAVAVHSGADRTHVLVGRHRH